jgi:hypothetical protein
VLQYSSYEQAEYKRDLPALTVLKRVNQAVCTCNFVADYYLRLIPMTSRCAPYTGTFVAAVRRQWSRETMKDNFRLGNSNLSHRRWSNAVRRWRELSNAQATAPLRRPSSEIMRIKFAKTRFAFAVIVSLVVGFLTVVLMKVSRRLTIF